VSLHVPLSAATHHLIDAAALARMKPTAILVNTARGPVVDQRALAAALHAGALGALLTLAPRPWFPAHAGRFGLTALEDQQLAGLVMWVPAGTLFTIFALAVMAAWLRRAEREMPSLGGAGVLIVAMSVAAALAGCDSGARTATVMTGGDAERGRAVIRTYGCHTCHTIPGVTGADATVGPPLGQLAARSFVAGRSNSPSNLIEWIRHPQHQRPASPMPEMNVTEHDARDIAAYLYTLR
jgi:cytochrome c2